MLKASLLGATALSLLFPLSAAAQSASDNAVEDTQSIGDGDIIVTANRREQNLQDVGVAVTAISGDSLRSAGITSTTEISQLVPGVYASGSLGGQSQQFTIRGVTQSDFNDAIEAPVAVYIDGLYIPTQQGQTMALFDVERVEMLKGPQGTLFGRNATGGLVNTLVTQPDASEVSGFANIGYARFNQVKAEAAVNVPLSDNAALRVSGYYTRIDNYWKNRFPGGMSPTALAATNYGPTRPSPCCQDEGGSRTYAARAQLKLEPADGLSIRLQGQFARQSLSTAPYTAVATLPTLDAGGNIIQSDRASPTETRWAIAPAGVNLAAVGFGGFGYSPNGPGAFVRTPGATWFGYVPLNPKDLELSSDFARNDLNRASGETVSGTIDYDLSDDITFSSISGYQHYKKSFLMDADGSPANIFQFGTKANTTAWSQELRLSGDSGDLRWTAGGYFLDIDARTSQAILGPRGSAYSAIFGLSATGVDGVAVIRLKTRSLSGFGQFEYDFAPQLTFILGGRIVSERQDYLYSSYAALNTDDYAVDDETFLFPLQDPAINPFASKRTSTLWTGKAQLEYRPADDLLLYFGVNRGVKGGSYNAPVPDGSPSLTPSQMVYKPEILTNYEGGFKWGDRDLSLNASAFHYDYRDYQAFLFSNASGYVQNVDSKVNGFDVDLSLQVTSALRVQASFAYTRARIKDFAVAPGVLRTVRPTYAPEKQANLSVAYTVPTPVAGGELKLNANVNYASGIFHNIRNFNSDWFAGRTLIDLNIGWRDENSGLSVSAYAKNLTDRRYGQVGFEATSLYGANIESYGMPRTFGFTVGCSF